MIQFDLLYQLCDAVKGQVPPECLNMTTFFNVPTEFYLNHPKEEAATGTALAAVLRGENHCGTTACMAGWATLLHRHLGVECPKDTLKTYGLDYVQWVFLFGGCWPNSVDAFRERVEWLESGGDQYDYPGTTPSIALSLQNYGLPPRGDGSADPA